MKSVIAIFSLIVLVIANVAALITAIVHDIATNQLLWVIIDCLFSPAGVIRGWLIWFGVV